MTWVTFTENTWFSDAFTKSMTVFVACLRQATAKSTFHTSTITTWCFDTVQLPGIWFWDHGRLDLSLQSWSWFLHSHSLSLLVLKFRHHKLTCKTHATQILLPLAQYTMLYKYKYNIIYNNNVL